MEIIRDIQKNKKLIESAIKKNGHLAQHNFYLFKNYGNESERPVFFFEKDGGIFAYENKKSKEIWHVLADPIAKNENKRAILFDFFEWVFDNGGEKIILEDITEELRKEILAGLKNKKWRAARPSYYLLWPVVNLKKWDGIGKDWKRLRNTWNKFFKEHAVKIKNASEVEKESLEKMLFDWKKQRNDTDRIHLAPYIKFIKDGFSGFDVVRIFEINGNPVSISAGWKIPNSRGAYYSCMGLYDYNYRNIGEVSYLDELMELKKTGYTKLDLGGSCGGLLEFKKKFHPEIIYKTYVFSVFRE